MAQDSELPPRELNTEDVATLNTAPKRSLARRHWGKLTLFTVVGVPFIAVVAWSYAALGYTYSLGTRVGYVQKLSKKGWVCKTWEGELQMSSIPGSAPQLFGFSVRSDSVAAAIEAAMQGRVELQYAEHPGVPLSCFGETSYFVVGVKPLGS
jgi:hypothetical protein